MVLEYVMRAQKISAPTGTVYWSVLGAPDTVGTFSGYNPSELTGITTDYTIEVGIVGTGTPVPPGVAGGDLGGSYPNPTVLKLQTHAVSATTPSDGYVLTWVDANNDWEPKASTTGAGTASGDLSGVFPSPTVAKINGATVPVAGTLTIGNVLKVSGSSTLTYGAINLAGGANFVTGLLPTANQVVQNMGGDVSGTTAASNVIKLQNRAVASTAPTDGYVLTWVNSNNDWEPKILPSTAPSGSAGGDLSGTYPNPTVAKLRGITVSSTAPTDGYVLTYVAGSTDWEPKPAASSGAVGSAGGDLSGTYPNPTVAKINSTTVPAGGSLTTGNVLQVSGASALTYGSVNLAGGSGFVSGILPSINQADQTLGGDLSGTTAAATVIKLQNRAVSSTAPTDGYALIWNAGNNDWEPTSLTTWLGNPIVYTNKVSLTTTTTDGYQVIDSWALADNTTTVLTWEVIARVTSSTDGGSTIVRATFVRRSAGSPVLCGSVHVGPTNGPIAIDLPCSDFSSGLSTPKFQVNLTSNTANLTVSPGSSSTTHWLVIRQVIETV